MIIKQTKVYKYRFYIIGIIVLVLIIWFVFREVKSIQAEDKAKDEYILQIRKQAQHDLEVRDSVARHKEDSLLMEILGIRTRVEYKIIEREKWITKYIDTASVRTKFLYLDSLFGPR